LSGAQRRRCLKRGQPRDRIGDFSQFIRPGSGALERTANRNVLWMGSLLHCTIFLRNLSPLVGGDGCHVDCWPVGIKNSKTVRLLCEEAANAPP
jgi:hypothetical protein